MKRLVVTCDGTWVDSDNGFIRDSWLPWKRGGHLATPSNVTRICRALLPRTDDGISQIAYYQAGVGSENNFYSYFLGGFLGSGINENIREAYAFLCDNYEDGDEIFLIGFSRGAFTARSIGGLIRDIGLLTGKGLDSFYPIFKDWENQANPDYKPLYGTEFWPINRPRFSDPSYVPKLVQDGLTRPNVPIKAIGVWETVGTLGVPEMEIFGVKLFQTRHKEYSFINQEVPSNLEFAYQALALDEERKAFAPTLWESPRPGASSKLKVLRQCWFPGVHSSVGGGYPDTSIADLTLAWMITQLAAHLQFDPQYILLQNQENVAFYESNHLPVASWAMGQIPQSDDGFAYTLTGRQVRTPGDYHATNPKTGKQLPQKLTDTHEFMHPSVRYRIQEKGPGLTKGASTYMSDTTYAPKALKGWKYFAPYQPWQDAAKGCETLGDDLGKWDGYGKWMVRKKSGIVTVIVEEKIEPRTDQMELLDAWPAVKEKVLN